MEIVNKTFLRQIITQCAGTQNIIKNLASCDPCGRKSGLKTVAFLLRLSICCLPFQQSVKTSLKIEVTHLCKCVLRHQFPTAIQLGKNKEPMVVFSHIFSLKP